MPKPRRVDWREAARVARQHPERWVESAARAALYGHQWGRPLSRRERQVIAIAQASPRGYLTLDTQGMSRDEIAVASARLWQNIDRAMNRRRKTPRRVIYFACLARSSARGWHLHALLWDYVPRDPVLLPQSKKLGFGGVDIKPIRPMTPNCSPGDVRTDAFHIAAYVIGQYHRVFGNDVHARHAPCPKGKRKYLTPQSSTIQRHEPRLFHRLAQAKDRSVSDDALCRDWP